MSQSQASSPPPAVVIGGMHRSGTSYAASVLQSAGLVLGERLLGPDPTNPRGHFEDRDFLELHQALLRDRGFADTGFVAGQAVEPTAAFRARAADLVAARRAQGRPWGWKDPRTVLLLDAWRELLPEGRYLIVFRPPWEVVDSLYRRGDRAFAADPPLALEVWRHFNTLLRDFARRHPELVVVREVSQIAGDPGELIDTLRRRFGLALAAPGRLFEPGLLAAVDAERAAFLAAAAPDCTALLAELRDLAGQAPDPDTGSTAAATILAQGLGSWQQVRALEKRLRDHEATAVRQAADHEAQLAAAEGRVAEATAQAARLSAEVQALATQVVEADAARDRARVAAARARADADRAARRLASVERSLDEQLAAGRDKDGRIAALEETVSSLWRSTSWRLTSPLRAAGGLFRGRLPDGVRFLLRRLASPAAAARAVARSVEVARTRGIGGLVAAIRAARAREDAASRQAVSPRSPEVRLPFEPPRPLRPSAGRRVADDAPTISLLVPVFDPPADILEATIASVLAQRSSRWQLVLVDDASRAAHVAEILARHAAGDPRITVHRRDANGGIAAATNDALARATGEFVAFLDHDDLLAPDAVGRCAEALAAGDIDVLYTDQDTIDAGGRPVHTFHKPDWSPEYLRHVMYVGHLLVVRRGLAERLGGLDPTFDGVQDFEFALRLGEATPRIAHLPEVLYHWRAVPGSVAAASGAKRGIDELQARAVQAHLDRCGIAARAAPHSRLPHRCVVTPRPAEGPRVSIVIPSRDRPDLIGPCLRSIFERTSWPDFEVVVVDTGTTDERALAILRSHPVRVVEQPGPFNFSAANNRGAAAATGEILVFLNNDTTVVSPDWLGHLAFHLAAADVGAVGPLLVYPDGSVQHAGVVLGARGTADHVMRRFPADADGHAGSLSCPREVSAVTGACLAIRRESLARVGGWNELFATHYQDVDLCLRLRRAGLRCLFTPYVRLVHHESPSRGSRYDMLDRLLLLDTWGDVLAAGDSFYPAACSLDRLDYSPRDPRTEPIHAG